MEGAIATQDEPRSARQEWTVGPAARLAGTTVRALHHYDAIGLVTPSGRSTAGYRTYSAEDIDRVRRVLLYRELGLPLARVAEVLAARDTRRPGGAAALLREQLALLLEQKERLDDRITAVELELEAHEMGNDLSQERKRELFGADWVENEQEYAQEAQARWGETEAWRESRRRTARLTEQDWQEARADAERIEQGLADLLLAGRAPHDAAAMDLAERHRGHIDRWFYPVTHEAHRDLADMYVTDERFTAYYERRAPGLARFVRDTVHANADRHLG